MSRKNDTKKLDSVHGESPRARISRQMTLLEKVWVPINVALIGAVAAIIAAIVSDYSTVIMPSTDAGFSYQVRVQARDTGEPIPNAEVTIEIGGKAPLDGIADANGLVRIFIDSSYVEQPGELTVRATGYEIHRQHIDVTKEALPYKVQLRKFVAVSSGPTPTAPLPDTITPPPTQSYPAPTLVSPAFGATIIGEELTSFSWQWDRDLQKGERFDLRIWQPEKPCCTVALLYEHSFSLQTPPDGFGHYLWQVAVVRIDKSGSKSTLNESEVRPFVWNDVLPTPTSTMTPAPTPEPDGVVSANALNLRSGPGVVYDVLGVLKQGDPLEIKSKCPAGKWLKVICPEGQEGWVACSEVKVNVDLAGVPTVTEIPPTPTPMYTPIPIATPTPTLLPPSILTEPENGAAFIGEPVVLRWRWDRPRSPDEVFSVRVYREGETRLCHHAQARDLEYKGSLSYCTAGKHYWGVSLARRLCADETNERCWQTLSEPSEERWFYYVPLDEPWAWPTPDAGDDDSGSGGEEPFIP